MKKSLHSKSLVGTDGRFPTAAGVRVGGDGLGARAENGGQARQKPHGSNGQPKDTANATAKVVWNACSSIFVEMHKDSLKKSLFIDRIPFRRAEIPIV